MSLRRTDLSMLLLQSKNSVVIYMEAREGFLFPWGLSAAIFNRSGCTWEELIFLFPI